MTRKKLRHYVKETGEIPFLKWYKKLDKSERMVVADYLDRISRFGSRNNIKSLKGGIFEVRIFHGSGPRIYFGEEDNKIILLLLGGNKRTQESDIVKARKYWRSYAEKK